MDIGLEKLIEMFEQRFGKFAANLLLGVIALAVIGVSFHLIFQYLVLPLADGVTSAFTWAKSALGTTRIPPLPNAPKVPHLDISWRNIVRIALLAVDIPLIVIFALIFGTLTRALITEGRINREARMAFRERMDQLNSVRNWS